MKPLATQQAVCWHVTRYLVVACLLAIVMALTAAFAVWCDPAIAHAAGQVDMPGPTGSGRFGSTVTVLPNGNFVVTDPAYDIPGGAINVGAVYLYDGVTHAMISVVMGSTAEDQVGSDGVTVLSNGSFVIRSPNWANGAATMAGAVTWADATVGITGTVSAANSLVGSTVNDRVGYSPLAVLSNGNYVVRSMFWSDGAIANLGAVTWGDGTTGATGVVSATNSLVGSSANDYVGSQYPTLLNNGNYVVLSPDWDYSIFATNAGAVTWGNGSTGTTGVVSVTNSLVGTRYDDQVGYGGVTALTNGNYVVASPNWNTGSSSKVGAATWADGSTGITGTVSAANSLVGTATYDYVSIKGIVALTNGNYVVASPQWGNRVGGVTWSLGTHGITGTINMTNSLVGSVTNDYAGYFGVVALTNGNYVVLTPSWQSYTGAVTWGNGATGITSTIGAANSLVGTAANHWVGYRGVLALANGNYVVNSARWDNGAVANVGAVTWGNGAAGITGTISVANSLIGSKTDDYIGGDQYISLYALTNGNYVVVSPLWDNDAATDAGAVTWGNGATGTSGVVGATNSLVGSTANDRLGLSGLTNGSVAVLNNGNYAVYSQYWTNGAAANAGAVTWGNGVTGISGPVSASNSLVGARAEDKVGSYGITALSNGNYVFLSPNWANGTATKAGAFTWGNGTTGLTGTLTSTNSITGERIDDQLGSGVSRFATGRYAVYNMYWDNGAFWNAGAVTWGNGIRSITGTITVTNSVVRAQIGPTNMNVTYDAVNSQLIVGRPTDNIVSFFDTREPPFLQLSKTVQPATAVAADGIVTYTVVLVNQVDGVDPGVFFTDTLSPATSFARWIDQGDAERTGNQITWKGVLTGSQPVTLTFQVTNTACGVAITNTALFSGSVHAGAASATYTAAKAETSTTLESGLNPATYGQDVVLTATVVVESPCTVTLSGEQIAFHDGATTLGLATLDANGVATYTASLLSGGVHTLTAVMEGSVVLTDSASSELVQTINKAEQTITFDPLIDRPYGVEAFTVTALASSGLTVVFTTTTPSVCTVSDDHVNLVASGVCTLSASQPGDNNYLAAEDVDRNFNVTCGDTVIVNSSADSGYRTLRGAITNLCEGGTITFAPLLAGQTITLTSGQALTLTRHMTITGLGADLLAVSGNDVTRIFVIDPGVHATMDGLTLRDGGLTGAKNGAGIQNNGALTVTNSMLLNNSTQNMGGGVHNTGALTLISSTVASNSAWRGAGIYNAGALALQHIVVTTNDASTNYGGGIYSTGAGTVSDSTFDNNIGGYGGGIYSSGAFTVTNSLFSANQTSVGGGSGIDNAGTMLVQRSSFISNTGNSGAGINNSGLVAIDECTFSDNSTTGYDGGGLNNSGTAVATNSTFVANRASSGGGIYSTGQLTVTNSTLFDNAANPSGSGGGIYNSGPFELRNTLIAGAITATNCVNTGAMIVNANNLVEDGSCSALWNGDPLLGALGDYGGPTWTLPLLPGSPAIDAANAAACLPTDQRGVTRMPAACDIGAFESQGFTLTLVGGDRQRTPVDFVFGEPLTLTVEAGSWQGKTEPIEAGQVTFAGPFTGAGVTPVTQTTAVAADGVAAIALTANHVTGVYSVTATLQGGNPPLAYTLTNFAPTTPTVTSDPGTAVFGQVVTFTAVVTAPYGVPTGSITFTFASTDVVAPLVDAMATMTRSDLAVGDHVVVAVYGGEGYFDPSQSALYTQTVIRAGSEITVTTAPNPSATTDTVTFTATVTALPPGAGLPTGDVTFTVGATVFTVPLDVKGIATAQRNDLTVGVHAVSAAYPGDTNFTAATVNGAGQVVQATLTVFMDGTGVGSLASEPAGINCSGTCRARFDPSTLVTVTATPLISSTFTGWNGAVSGVGNPAVLTIDADEALTATFTIKSYVITPTAGVNGSITPAAPQTLIYDAGKRFDINAEPHHHIQDVAVDGVSVGAVSAYTFTHVTADHVITAAFAIDTHTLAVVKTGAGVGSVAQEPAGVVFDYGTVVTLTAQPVLTSTFTNWSGDASGTTNPLLVTVDRDKEITGTFIIQPLPTTTTLQSGLNPAYVGDVIVFTVEVAENIGPFGVRAADGPTGQIELSDPTGAISLTGELVNGGVQLESSSLDAGSYSVAAAYSGDTYHEPSVSNLVVQIVNRYATVTSLKLAPNPVLLGDQVYFTATVAWDFGFDVAGLAPQGDPILGPTGTVDVLANGVPVANAQLSNGVARIHSAVPMTGAVSITAHYRGDRASAPSVSKEVTLRIKHRTSTVILTTAPNPSQPGATVVLTATVQATPVELTDQPGIDSQADLGPTGEIIFAAQGVEFGRSAIVNGVANLDYAQLPEGSHTLTARYPGDDTFTGSTSAPYVQLVQPLPTAVNDAAGVVQGQVRKVEVLANDRDPAGGGLTVTDVTQPAHGTAIIGAAGQFVYFRAATNASGLENFTYTATDANGSTSTALVSMLVASQGGGQGVPYVAAVDPALGANLAFTTSGTVVDLELSPGFYTGTLPLGDTFFMAFTPYITATSNTTTPPAGFKFGNLQFDLTSYATGTPLHGVTFAIPLTLTIDYDPAMVDNLDPATLGLFHWDGSEWSTDGITIVEHNVAAHTVTIAVSHLSEFALFAAPAGPVVTDHIYLPNLQDDDIPPIGPEPELVNPAPAPPLVAPVPFEMAEQVFLPAMEK